MHSLPFVCLACRKSWKVEWSGFNPAQHSPQVMGRRCPQCAGPLRYGGRYFKAPPENALKAWREVEEQLKQGGY